MSATLPSTSPPAKTPPLARKGADAVNADFMSDKMPILPLEPSSTPSPTSGGTAHMLPAERAKASFDSNVLVKIVRGNRPDTIEKFRPLFEGAPFDDQDMDTFRSYEELWTKEMERHVAAMKIVRENPEFRIAHQSQKVQMGTYVNTGTYMGIHFGMFLAQIQTQTTPEQRAKWLPAALKANYWGVYAQTELGHGSNVRGIETTATYDKATQEFVIHSPTLTSMKWWPSGMYGATHGAVFARLIIDGKDYGFHGFMVQFRDVDGFLMPGVEVGEIGPKLNGFNTNIGYGRFNQVRIPLFNMFAKRQQVLPDGTYVPAPPKLARFKYISMMQTRNAFVGMSYSYLAMAATILVRYSCVRQQGFKDSQASSLEDSLSSGEHTVMDYKNQQYRSLKAIGLAYLFFWSSRYTSGYLKRVQKRVDEGDETAGEELNELHVTLAGLKVASTVAAHDHLEECRRDCGGQGFLIASGVSDLGRSFGVASTGEGDRTILNMQVARFLIKSAVLARTGKQSELVGSVTYLREPPMGTLPPSDFSGRSDQLVALLRCRAGALARQLERDFEAAQQQGMNYDAAINAVAVLGYKAADAHSWFVMADNTFKAIPDAVKDAATLKVLNNLFELTLLQHVHENLGDWLGVLSAEHPPLILRRINELLTILRPDVVALTDSFGFLDQELHHSTLGGYDGNVYESIYAAARKSPLNQSRKMVGWDMFVPMLDREFLREGMRTQRAGGASSKL